MPLNPKLLNGPIPGENYTSDTKNYPWHRPPEITDLDAGVEAAVKRLTEKDAAYALLTMLQAGVSVVVATDMFVTSGISSGKWTPDFAILLAGPVSHIIKLMADGYGIKYDMGLDNEPPPTIEFLKGQQKIDPKKAVTVADSVAAQKAMFTDKADAQQQPQGVGLMGAPDPNSPMGPPQGPQEEQTEPAQNPQEEGVEPSGGLMSAPPPQQ
jgi:hypothetical protein